MTLKSVVSLISITGLKPTTTYRFRVAATNDLGTSRFSESILITTELEGLFILIINLRFLLNNFYTGLFILFFNTAPSLIVDDLRTLGLSTRTIKLFWTAIFSHKSEHVDGFYIGYRAILPSRENDPQNKLPAYTFKTMHDIPAWQRFSSNTSSPIASSSSSSSSSDPQSQSLTSFCEKFSSDSSHKSRSMSLLSKKSSVTKALNGKDISSQARVRCSYEFTLDSLARKTRYGIIVQAFNLKGTGPSSTETQVVTLAKDPPGKVRLKLLNTTIYEAALNWNLDDIRDSQESSISEQEQDYQLLKESGNSMPLPEEDIVDGFIISYRSIVKNSALQESEHDEFYRKQKSVSTSLSGSQTSISDNWETISVSGRINTYVLRSLRCGTHYRVRVEAFNDMGSGESSDLLEFSTLGKGKFLYSLFLFHQCFL